MEIISKWLNKLVSLSGYLTSFSQRAVAEESSMWENKFVSSANEDVFDFRIWGAIMIVSGVAGTISVGDVFTVVDNDNPGVTRSGTVTGVNGTEITYDIKELNNLKDGETVTFTGGPGGTATLVSHDAGAHIYYSYYESAVKLKTGTVQGQRALIQTTRPFPYIAGQGHRIMMTSIAGTPMDGRDQYVQFGDDLNAIGKVLKGKVLNYLTRSNTSGSPVDTLVPRSKWNVNQLFGRMFGGFKKSVNLIITNNQIDWFGLQWLGVGRAKYGVDIEGERVNTHNEDHANKTVGVYIKSPTQPLRYEVYNSGTPEAPAELTAICQSVATEGKARLPGTEFCISRSLRNELAVATASGETPVIGIRLKNTLIGGYPNRKILQLLRAEYTARTNDASFKTYHVHNPKGVTGGTWVDVGNTGIQVNYGLTAFDGSHIHEIDASNITTGLGTKAGGKLSDLSIISNHSYIAQNLESDNSQMFVMIGDVPANTANLSGHFSVVLYE